MKHFALIAVAGSMLAFAGPAKAAELPAVPAPMFSAMEHAALPVMPVAAWDDDDWRRDRRWRGRDDRRWRDDRNWGRGRDAYWRDDRGRWRCRRDDGTVGLLIGAGVGALVGRQIDQRGDRTLGTVLGAVGGGLLGREIDRGDVRCR